MLTRVGTVTQFVATDAIRYGDYMPRSSFGRFVMGVWMFVGFVNLGAVLGR